MDVEAYLERIGYGGGLEPNAALEEALAAEFGIVEPEN